MLTYNRHSRMVCCRFALDGCDPASYSGILWCFGKHDTPKQVSLLSELMQKLQTFVGTGNIFT